MIKENFTDRKLLMNFFFYPYESQNLQTSGPINDVLVLITLLPIELQDFFSSDHFPKFAIFFFSVTD